MQPMHASGTLIIVEYISLPLFSALCLIASSLMKVNNSYKIDMIFIRLRESKLYSITMRYSYIADAYIFVSLALILLFGNTNLKMMLI